jgi:FkbM family methyltransferase
MEAEVSGSGRLMERSPSRVWEVLALLLRKLPHFKGKSWLSHQVTRHLRGKGLSTTIVFDLGERIRLDLDDWIPYWLFVTGVYERKHSAFFRGVLREGMTVLDIGADIGYYTLQAAVRVGDSGRVHSFEPVDTTYAKLRENVELNGLENVCLNQVAVHDHEGTVEVFVAKENSTGASKLTRGMGLSGRSQAVRCLSIDDYLRERSIETVDVVKIDVEGSEPYVVKGMRSTLEANPDLVLFMEINQPTLKAQGSSAEDLVEYMTELGFRPYSIRRGGEARPLTKPLHDDPLVLFRRTA